MIKKLLGALLCGAAVFSMGFFSSCKTDVSDLDERMRIIEAEWADLKVSLSKAVTDGLYLIAEESGHSEDKSKYTVALSNGHKLEIPLNSGTKVSVEIKEGVATITVDGTAYNIPLGSSVNSFVFVDEVGDRKVKLGNSGANVKFLVTPAPSAEVLAKASFEFADIMAYKTRVGATGEFTIAGAAKIENGYVVVPIKGLNCEAGKTYGVAAQMSLSGTTLSSDYFKIEVASDFAFKAIEIDANIKPIESLGAKLNANDNTWSVTLSGEDFLDKDVDMKAWFTGVPEGAVFKAANSTSQLKGDARDKASLLAKSITPAGMFHFAERPGTTFSKDVEIVPAVGETPAITRKGFAIDITVDFITKARIYVSLIDPVTITDWTGGFFPGIKQTAEAEWGGRYKFVGKDANRTINLAQSFLSHGDGTDKTHGDQTLDWGIVHRGATGFFDVFKTFKMSNEGKILFEHNGQKIEMTDEGKRLATKSEGFFWFINGFVIRQNECDGANKADWESFKYTMPDGSTTTGRANEIKGYGGPKPGNTDWNPAPDNYYTWKRVASFGVTISKDGVLTFGEGFGNYSCRMVFGMAYQWYYGEKRIASKENDVLGYFFFNRRHDLPVADVTYPTVEQMK